MPLGGGYNLRCGGCGRTLGGAEVGASAGLSVGMTPPCAQRQPDEVTWRSCGGRQGARLRGPWSAHTFYTPEQGGHWDVLQWAAANGCPDDAIQFETGENEQFEGSTRFDPTAASERFTLQLNPDACLGPVTSGTGAENSPSLATNTSMCK